MEHICRIGMDTSKHFFQLHGVNAAEEPVVRKKLRRKDMVAFFEKLAPTVVAIEACGGSHHWARLLSSFGHQVKLIAPQLVKPYVICGRPPMASVFWRFERFGRLRSYVRPVCAEHISAGLDEVRLPGSLSSARA